MSRAMRESHTPLFHPHRFFILDASPTRPEAAVFCHKPIGFVG